jgi:hypothetical protein
MSACRTSRGWGRPRNGNKNRACCTGQSPPPCRQRRGRAGYGCALSSSGALCPESWTSHVLRRLRLHQAFGQKPVAASLGRVTLADGSEIRGKGFKVVVRQASLHLFFELVLNQLENLADACLAAQLHQGFSYRPPKIVLRCAKSSQQAKKKPCLRLLPERGSLERANSNAKGFVPRGRGDFSMRVPLRGPFGFHGAWSRW